MTHVTQSASGTAPRTFGEAVQARAGVADTVQRLVYIAVVLTLIVAGCSLAVRSAAAWSSASGRSRCFASPGRRRRRCTGWCSWRRCCRSQPRLPWRPGIAYAISVLTVRTMAPAGTPVPVPGHAYFLTMGVGLAASLLVIAASLPLLGRITGPAGVRFE